MIGIVAAAVLGVAVLTLVWLRLVARQAERRSVRDYERALGALGGMSRRTDRSGPGDRAQHVEAGRAHVRTASGELPQPRVPSTGPAPRARIELPARRTPDAGSAGEAGEAGEDVAPTTRLRPVAPAPRRSGSERYAPPKRVYGPPIPGVSGGGELAGGAEEVEDDAAASLGAEPPGVAANGAGAGSMAAGRTLPAGARPSAEPPARPSGEPPTRPSAEPPARPSGEPPTELVQAVDRQPPVAAALDQLVARSRRAKVVGQRKGSSSSQAVPPPGTSSEGQLSPAQQASLQRSFPERSAGDEARTSRDTTGAAALLSTRSLRTRLPLPNTEAPEPSSPEQPAPGGGRPGKRKGEPLGAKRARVPGGPTGVRRPDDGASDYGPSDDGASDGGPSDDASDDGPSGLGPTRLGPPDDEASSTEETDGAVPIVFDFDELAEPALPITKVRPIRGLRPPGSSRRALRAATGAAAIVALAAVGVGVWELTSKSPPDAAPVTAREGSTPGTKAPPPRHHASGGSTSPHKGAPGAKGGSTSKSGGERGTTSASTPTTQASATLQPISQTSLLAVYQAPSGTYTLSFTVSSGECWVGAHVGSTYSWQATISPAVPASYSTSGTTTVRLGAPSVLAVRLNGKPVTLPKTVQPFDIEFAASPVR